MLSVTEVPPFRPWCYLTSATPAGRSKVKSGLHVFRVVVFDEHKAIDVVIRCYQCSDILGNLLDNSATP